MTVKLFHHFAKHTISLYIMLLIVSFCSNSYAQDEFDSSMLDAFNVTIKIEDVGSYIFPALYMDPDGLYVPVESLFGLLKIVNKTSEEGKVVKGFVETEANPYEINYPKRFITFRNKTIQLDSTEAVMDVGTLYLKASAYKKAFGFEMSLNFRALTASFKSEFELPVVKLNKQKKAREKAGARRGDDDVVYDTIFKRDYHWMRGGMIDWSVASSQAKEYVSETRVELGGGAEVLGGEANIFLNWSNVYGMSRQQQNYNWRWADNDAKVVKQVQLGRVNSRSVASLLSPIDGFTLTNAPTTVRRALGNYVISDYTDPDWVIELYINNVLTAYTKSDASGFYTFTMPIIYGTSNIVLRFYGPGGEMRSEQKSFSMPYNMLPKGEFEYKITGGVLMDSLSSKYGRVETNFGFARWLSAGIGTEYLSSISVLDTAGILSPIVPFANFTLQPFSKLLITGEYAHNVRWKTTMNLTLPLRSVLELNYARYTPGQKAIIYNYLEERMGSFSLPYRVRNLSGYLKSSVRQNIYENFTYNSSEIMLSANYRDFNMNYSNFLNWTPVGNTNIYGNLSLGLKFGKYLSFRPSAQFNYTTNKLVSLKGEVETKMFSDANIAFRYENSVMSNTHSFNLSFRYDLPYVATYIAAGYSSRHLQASESARGSFSFGSGKKHVIVDKRGSVGRAGLSIESFVDINFNGKRDKGEPSTERLKIRCSGGQMQLRDKDSLVRITGLEPFVTYTLIFDETSFESLTWKLPFKNVKVTTDPNQFKKIMVPVLPMGEISGLVADDKGNALGRILVVFIDEEGKKVAQTISESDGYFTYIGFKPGVYKVAIDSMQLQILKRESDPVTVTVKPDIQGDVVDVGNIEWRDMPGYINGRSIKEVQEEEDRKAAESAMIGATKSSETIPVVSQPVFRKPEPTVISLPEHKATSETMKVKKIVPWSMEIAVVHYVDGSYCLQLGAYKTAKPCEDMLKKVLRLFPGAATLVEENNMYKLRTNRSQSLAETIRFARKVQATGVLGVFPE
jgi:hypothetical protein